MKYIILHRKLIFAPANYPLLSDFRKNTGYKEKGFLSGLLKQRFL